MCFMLYSRNEACLKYLLEVGCDIESEDGNKRTPLHWAAQNNGELTDFFKTTIIRLHVFAGSINCLQLLIMLGADCNKTDGEGLNGRE